MPETQRARTDRALNIVAKWRTAFAGWQVGTRSKDDPVAAAIRDHREATLLLRVEVTALGDILLRKGLITHEEYLAAVEREAVQLNLDLAARFPGITANEYGLHFAMPQARETMKDWPA